jgi:hypothetical protein
MALSFEFSLAKMDDLARSGHLLEALAHGREFGVKIRMDSGRLGESFSHIFCANFFVDFYFA